MLPRNEYATFPLTSATHPNKGSERLITVHAIPKLLEAVISVMMHPDTELRFVSPEIGYGVFATSRIPRGTIVYVKDALEIQISSSSPVLHSVAYREIIEKYSFIEPDGTRVISWDIAKYVNHCCDANTMSTGYGFEIAIREIEAGDEITDEYGLFNLDYEMCLSCSRSGCRGRVRPDDLERYHQEWDARVVGALSNFNTVDQPLIQFLDDRSRHDLDLYLTTGEGYRGVYSLHAEPKISHLRAL